MDNQLVQRYQNIQATVNDLETKKVKAQTELEIKEKDLNNIVEQIKAMGIEPENIEKARQEMSQSFEKALSEAEEALNAVSRT